MAIAATGRFGQTQAQNTEAAQKGVQGTQGKQARHGVNGKAGKHGKAGKAGKAGKLSGGGQSNFASSLHANNSVAVASSGNSQVLSNLLGGGQSQASAGFTPGLGGALQSFSSVGF